MCLVQLVQGAAAPLPSPIATALIFLHLWVSTSLVRNCLAFTLETRSLQACIYRICLRQEGRHSLSREGLNACTFLIVKTYLPRAHMSHGMTENQEE